MRRLWLNSTPDHGPCRIPSTLGPIRDSGAPGHAGRSGQRDHNPDDPVGGTPIGVMRRVNALYFGPDPGRGSGPFR